MTKFVAIIVACVIVGIIGHYMGANETTILVASGATAIATAALFAPRSKRDNHPARRTEPCDYPATAAHKEYVVYRKSFSRGVFVNQEHRRTVTTIWASDKREAQRAADIYGPDVWVELVMR